MSNETRSCWRCADMSCVVFIDIHSSVTMIKTFCIESCECTRLCLSLKRWSTWSRWRCRDGVACHSLERLSTFNVPTSFTCFIRFSTSWIASKQHSSQPEATSQFSTSWKPNLRPLALLKPSEQATSVVGRRISNTTHTTWHRT